MRSVKRRKYGKLVLDVHARTTDAFGSTVNAFATSENVPIVAPAKTAKTKMVL